MAESNPNIANELGHTHYPKWVDTNQKDEKGKVIRKIVHDEKEEQEVTGGGDKKAAGWDTKK
jgi:hypothetical protein